MKSLDSFKTTSLIPLNESEMLQVIGGGDPFNFNTGCGKTDDCGNCGNCGKCSNCGNCGNG
jgi:hypothetical protein